MDIQGKRVLTGVKPTGTLHIGNYVGAIKPAIQLGNDTLNNGGEFLMFLADYHALNYMKNAEHKLCILVILHLNTIFQSR